MNRLKHSEDSPSSAPTLWGILKSIHYSHSGGEKWKFHKEYIGPCWAMIGIHTVPWFTRGDKYLSWGIYTSCSSIQLVSRINWTLGVF